MFVTDLENNESKKQLKQLSVGDIIYLYTSYAPAAAIHSTIEVIYGCVIGTDNFLNLAPDDLEYTKFVVFNLKTQKSGSLCFTYHAANSSVNCVLYDGDKEFWRFVINDY
jgi:hypothetical protein